jgi:hypothetical protein
MKTKIRSFVLIALATLLLTACRVVVETELKADGSGKFRTAIVFTTQEKENFAQKPENKSKSICGDAEKNLPAGATFVEEIHAGETYCVTEHSFNNLAELRKFYVGMDQVKVNTLQFESGKFMLDIDIDLTSDNHQKGLVNEWHLTLPGEIGEQNADRMEGKTLVWVVSPGEKAHLQAESAVGLNPATVGITTGMLILIAGGILVMVFIGMVVIFLLLRKNRQK